MANLALISVDVWRAWSARSAAPEEAVAVRSEPPGAGNDWSAVTGTVQTPRYVAAVETHGLLPADAGLARGRSDDATSVLRRDRGERGADLFHGRHAFGFRELLLDLGEEILEAGW